MYSKVRTLVKNAAYQVAALEPFLAYLRRSMFKDRILVLMYHELADDADDIESWTVVRKSDFVRQMEYLKRHYDILSLDEAVSRMESTGMRTLGRPGVVITFDDGYSGNSKILLPIVKSMNLPVTIYIATMAVQDGTLYWYDRLISAIQGVHIDLDLTRHALGIYCFNRCKGAKNWAEAQRLLGDMKKMNPEQRAQVLEDVLRELSATDKKKFYQIMPLSVDEVKGLARCPLVTIGAHSHCHNILTQISEERLIESLRTSKTLLEQWTGRPIDHFAYPNGNFDDGVIEVLRRLEFKTSVTTHGRLWAAAESSFTIPRIGIGRYDAFSYFKFRTAGGNKLSAQSGLRARGDAVPGCEGI